MLALIFTLAANTAAPAVPADGTYTYVSSMNGVAIGKTAITVKHDASGITLSEQGGGSFNGQQGTVKDTLMLDPQALSPTGYTLSAVVDGRPVNAAVTFKGTEASQTGDLAQKTYDLVQDTKHFVVLGMGPFSGWFALPSEMQAWNAAPAMAIVPEMGSGVTISPDASAKSDRPNGVPSTDTAISVSTPVSFTLWFDPNTMLVDRLDFPTQGVTVARQP
jgi:hypothetical protein